LDTGAKLFTVVLFAPGSVKELGIPVILTTLPCNGFAFGLKNKKNNFALIRVTDLGN
jgi:hypothetical protein